jgi:hypothetical protein
MDTMRVGADVLMGTAPVFGRGDIAGTPARGVAGEGLLLLVPPVGDLDRAVHVRTTDAVLGPLMAAGFAAHDDRMN